MDKETAAAIQAWIKAAKKEFTGSQTDYARGWRQACVNFSEVIKVAAAGDLWKLEDR